MRLTLDYSEDPVPVTAPPRIDYLLWRNTDVIAIYETPSAAVQALQDYREAHAGEWRAIDEWHWCELHFGVVWRLQVDQRPVLSALPIIQTTTADVAPSDTTEAL